MKKVLFFTFALVLCFSASVHAETKVAVFNMQQVLSMCDYGVEVASRIKAKFEPMEKQLERDAKEIQALEAELQNQDLALKLEAKQDKQREYRRLMRDYQDSVTAYRQKRQIENQKEGQPILKLLAEALDAYCKKNGISVVFDTSTQAVVYAAPTVDIANDLIKELNKMKKAGK